MSADKTVIRFAGFLLALLLCASFILQWGLFMLTIVLANGLVVLGCLLFLRAGLVSFGQALYFCFGAYTTGLAANFLNVTDVFLLLLMSAVTSGIMAWLLGVLLSKYRAIFFGLLSMAFSMILYGLLAKTESLGSTDGFNVPAVTILGYEPSSESVRVSILAVAALLALLAVSFGQAFLKSPMGLLLTAIRDNEIRVEYMGASAQKTIHTIYVIGGVFAGLAGSIVAVSVGHIDPTMAVWTTSGEFVFITIMGGIGSVIAPFLGALAFGIIHTVAFSESPNTWQLVLGTALIGIIYILPDGLWSLLSRLRGDKK